MSIGRFLVIAAATICFTVACARNKENLVVVPVPDVAALEPSVRNASAEARAQFDKSAAAKPTQAELANAYGELAMSYHANSLVPAAEAAYRNAIALAPRDKRWPYLQGHLYNDNGRMEDAIKSFDAARRIDNDDGPILFSLAGVSLQHGDLDTAQALYEQLQSKSGEKAAVLVGLGKVALIKRQYAVAAEHFEEALRLSPTSSRLRQPLALAYRGLGDHAMAQHNLALYTVEGVEPSIADPIIEVMASKVASLNALLRRGQRALEAKRFDVAEMAFSAIVKSDPKDAKALAYLGLSLLSQNRSQDAEKRLSESLKIDGDNALAHFSLGVIYDRQGKDMQASEKYEAALKRDPENVNALLYLADAKMRMGSPVAAAELYRKAVPYAGLEAHRMQFALAMAWVKSKRYMDALKVMEATLAAQPSNLLYRNALARLLATAPDDSVRDGKRAREMAKAIFQSTRHPEVAQTYAMACAETGSFEEAISLQQQTIIVVERAGSNRVTPFLRRNLAIYEQRRPVREGWSEDDPLLQPRSPAVSLYKVTPSS